MRLLGSNSTLNRDSISYTLHKLTLSAEGLWVVTGWTIVSSGHTASLPATSLRSPPHPDASEPQFDIQPGRARSGCARVSAQTFRAGRQRLDSAAAAQISRQPRLSFPQSTTAAGLRAISNCKLLQCVMILTAEAKTRLRSRQNRLRPLRPAFTQI